jgi:hypothetical protein
MTEQNFDDPAVEDAWCKEQFFAVAEFLQDLGIVHGRIDEKPSFLVAPYVSLWGVCSPSDPVLTWWVIIGDLPTDCISAESVRNPRVALRTIGERWLEAAAYMQRGKPHPTMQCGNPASWAELAPLLESRAQTIIDWAKDDELWDYEP